MLHLSFLFVYLITKLKLTGLFFVNSQIKIGRFENLVIEIIQHLLSEHSQRQLFK